MNNDEYQIGSTQRQYIRDGRAPIPYNEVTSRVMSANKGKGTGPELIVRKYLWHNGLKGYRLNWKKAPGRPDICYSGKKVAIFIHGCFWHRCPYCNPSTPKTNSAFWEEKFKRNEERDRKKLFELENSGWKVIVIWECQTRSDLTEWGELIRELLNK